jgi:5-methylcytosine-specific restriction endonuclease McrBC GTP-binding regulatory subunit McrB
MEGMILCDKVQKIIDTFNMLSPENQSTLLEYAYNILELEKIAKKSGYTSKHEERAFEEGNIKPSG